MCVYAWMKECVFFRYWLRSFSPLSLRQNRLYPLVRVCENYNEHCPVKSDPDSQELTAACGLSLSTPRRRRGIHPCPWSSPKPPALGKWVCGRLFLRSRVLQASRSPPAQALPAEGALGRGRGRGCGVGVAMGAVWAWPWARRGRGCGHGQGRGQLITPIRARPSSSAFGFNFPTPSLPCAPRPNITNWASLVTLADVNLGRKIPTNRDFNRESLPTPGL